MNVTEPLADLRIKTYSGRGNVDIGISYYSPPTPEDFWWGEPIGFDEDGNDGKETTVEMEAWSSGPGNEEEVHLFDVEPGLYYITAYSFREARGFTIVADFVYPPENVDPDDAITLTPGVEYGLLSGYDGLNQYFKVEVPQGTERLVVDLNDGAGEASLFMRLDQAPTSGTYDHHSTADGANDRIAFNDPTPGWWYILLTSESAFTGVNIVAEFATATSGITMAHPLNSSTTKPSTASPLEREATSTSTPSSRSLATCSGWKRTVVRVTSCSPLKACNTKLNSLTAEVGQAPVLVLKPSQGG